MESKSRETLKQGFANGIIDDDAWMVMLRVRNQLAHDYDGEYAKKEFDNIVQKYIPVFERMKEQVSKYYEN